LANFLPNYFPVTTQIYIYLQAIGVCLKDTLAQKSFLLCVQTRFPSIALTQFRSQIVFTYGRMRVQFIAETIIKVIVLVNMKVYLSDV
jgi:hypothetical protein